MSMAILEQLAAARPKIPIQQTRQHIEEAIQQFLSTKDPVQAKFTLERIGELVAGESTNEQADKVQLQLLEQRKDIKNLIQVSKYHIPAGDPSVAKGWVEAGAYAGLKFDFTDESLTEKYNQFREQYRKDQMKSLLSQKL